MNRYEITFPTFWREPLTKIYEAETAGRARYLCYLQFRDAYEYSFYGFLMLIKVRKVKESK